MAAGLAGRGADRRQRPGDRVHHIGRPARRGDGDRGRRVPHRDARQARPVAAVIAVTVSESPPVTKTLALPGVTASESGAWPAGMAGPGRPVAILIGVTCSSRSWRHRRSGRPARSRSRRGSSRPGSPVLPGWWRCRSASPPRPGRHVDGPASGCDGDRPRLLPDRDRRARPPGAGADGRDRVRAVVGDVGGPAIRRDGDRPRLLADRDRRARPRLTVLIGVTESEP